MNFKLKTFKSKNNLKSSIKVLYFLLRWQFLVERISDHHFLIASPGLQLVDELYESTS